MSLDRLARSYPLPWLSLALTHTAAFLCAAPPSLALPPPEDTPEEILRTEIIPGARSPIDGKPLSAAEYKELQLKLQQAPPRPPEKQVTPGMQRFVRLLKLRRFVKRVLPFVPIR